MDFSLLKIVFHLLTSFPDPLMQIRLRFQSLKVFFNASWIYVKTFFNFFFQDKQKLQANQNSVVRKKCYQIFIMVKVVN